MPEALVVGSGPNGLAAAITLAQAGLAVEVREAQPFIGGGATSAALTLEGFVHDVCSAVHPMAIASPFFQSLPLAAHGLEWIHPPVPLAHPLEGADAALLHRSLTDTAQDLAADGAAWRAMFQPLVTNWRALTSEILRPMRIPPRSVLMARFGVQALSSARSLATSSFRDARARALFAGIAAHSTLPLEHALSSAIALVLGAAAHTGGWPIPRGGSQRISDALASILTARGGRITTSSRVNSLDLRGGPVLCDVSPRELVRIAGTQLTAPFRRELQRFRYGPGVFKVDYALSSPIPWRARDCALAATVHVCGTLDEISLSERDAWEGRPSERPFLLVTQPSLFDDSRAPAGRHTAWVYCHVPSGSDFDMLDRIERQLERFAPGFRDCVLARSVLPPAALEARNANLAGGAVAGGVPDLAQSLLRPSWRHYSTPVRNLYICSSSTPPGAGVHGMCGWNAARQALERLG